MQESAVGIECEVRPDAAKTAHSHTHPRSQLYQSIDIKAPNTDDVTHTLVLGLIKQVHVRNAVLTEDGSAVDPAKLRAVARLGGSTYARVLEGFDLDRPSWKVYKEKLANMDKP